jgi:hypothetical protein
MILPAQTIRKFSRVHRGAEGVIELPDFFGVHAVHPRV